MPRGPPAVPPVLPDPPAYATPTALALERQSRTPEPFSEAEKTEAERLILSGLKEDLPAGDPTSEVLIPQGISVCAHYVARKEGILCGLPVVALLFRELEPAISLRPLRSDGDKVHAGEPFLELVGPVQPILRGERLSLNFLQRLSGIASLTHRFAEAVEGTGCLLYDTRKTTPGWRALEKYAVRMGGGRNHRRSLSEFALIKDNHRQVLEALGDRSMAAWLERLRARQPDRLVELEVDAVEEVPEALKAGPDLILLDNFSIADLRRAVQIIRGHPGKQPLIEASGGISLENVREVAAAGVDRLAVGKITHSAAALDLGLDLVEVIR
ncbi:MAG: carboxylating nicotinate-nucleotide diphosphorylase [Planctomycetes bacterium]|nr:carboxylating nicotinate-nucleotide diphosphorylase [Planctomycetota bacterium]